MAIENSSSGKDNESSDESKWEAGDMETAYGA